MCMEDVAIARATKTNVYRSDGDAVNIPANANRLSIRTVADGNARFSVDVVRPPVQGGFSSNNPTIVFIDTTLGLAGDANSATRVIDTRLEDVGSILLGPLQMNAIDEIGFWVFETYLDLNDPSLAKYNTGGVNASEILKRLGIGV